VKQVELKRFLVLSVLFIGMSAFVLPGMSYGSGGDGAQYLLGIDVSPKSINIESERGGDIRILTDMRYSFYVTSGHSIFIYFNESDSVESIRATRDSLGNLILKFSLEELLFLENWLKPNTVNDVRVVVSMDNGDEYMGQGEVMITKKR
jgi:hypothetical protein